MCNRISGFLLAAMLLGGVCQAQAGGGVSLGNTRVIYNEKDRGGATLRVNNSADNMAYLIQSWASEYKEAGKKAPFMVSPPLYRQDKGTSTLRITRAGGNFPADRESVFMLNVKAIPGENEDTVQARGDKGSVLKFSFLTQIKLFWRPAGLSGQADEAYKQLTFSRASGALVVKNPTPYFINLHTLTVAGKDISEQGKMISPFGEQRYSVAGSPDKISFQVLNDQGVMSDTFERAVQ
ncbi:molecular chaperone [Rahnella aceris]|uniref:fimbrial biogenesis chaperone n=1 Tax=Rahnella sp. (strain Y9602) TaxID=2703885 RepID=UPI001C266919|nr:molecular chaperone [Rahnella aceris]MBU9839254.1 molecular chaperone [Rahnella aceris]